MTQSINKTLLFTSPEFIKQKEFWLSKLTGDTAETKLLVANENYRSRKRDNVWLDIPFPGHLCSAVLELGKHSDIAIYIILLAALKSLIYRYTGNEDITVISPVYQEFVSRHTMNRQVFIRDTLNRDTTFRELLLLGKQSVIEAYDHQDYPYELAAETALVASGNRCISNVVCALKNIHAEWELKEENDNLVFLFYRENDRINGQILYNPDLYSSYYIKQISNHFITLLGNAVQDVGKKIPQIPLLSEEENKRLVYDFNRTEVAYPQDRTIHQLFEEQVERTPGNIAVVYDDHQLTYGALNERANQLAKMLRKKGKIGGSIVGLIVEPSIVMVVGMMAILKAGGAYLPVDPESPLNRVISMLEDCQVHILLATTTTTGKNSFAFLKNIFMVKTVPRETGVRPQLTNLDDLPIPDRSLVNYDKYMSRIGQAWVKHSLAIFATRGCPYKCAYCHKIWPKRHVVRSAENIFAEVKLYYNMGVRRFAIIDDIFNMNVKNSRKFFRLIIENKLEVQLFFPNGMRGDLLTTDYIDLMVEAGTVSIALALETASPRLQKLIGKNLKIEKFKENLEYFCEKYPQVIIELFTMIGFPGETEEEALMTLDFIKSIKGIHFPYINILRIYSNTDMYRMAVENGVAPAAIFRSENLYFHEIPDTLPFDKSFAAKLQTDFLNEYFLSKERLLRVMPHQMKIFTIEEIIQKYNSYLMIRISDFSELLQITGITEDELGLLDGLDEAEVAVPNLDEQIQAYFPSRKPTQDSLKVLFLDLSQFFSRDTDRLDVIYDPPLGMMAVMSYMNQRFGDRVDGHIVKSRVDFDSYWELRTILQEFQPDIIGMRTLTYYRDFFHQTAALIRQWGFDTPIITGGPYATSNYNTLLQDRNIDLAVLGEGEVTFSELIEKMLENGNQLPGREFLQEIPGLAFVPGEPGREKRDNAEAYCREIVMLDEIAGQLQESTGKNLKPGSGPRHPAYIMYTSGSTGIPKGVIIEHKNVVNNLHWFGKTYNLGPGIHFLELTNYTFDASVEDIFGSLLFGAAVYVVKSGTFTDINDFCQFINKNQVHIIDFVPTMLKELLCHEQKLESLRIVISGGEKLEDPVKDRIIERGYQLFNNYGPTETTVDALVERCTADNVSLGRPIDNVTCYILNKNDNPVPIGIAGELCISGAGVARGYLNRPELNYEKFAANPFDKGKRMFRTGDLARFLYDGRVEFLGRVDHQVKIRGYRIELGEIENRLKNFPGIKEIVVLVTEDESGDKHLCAYYVSDIQLSVSELREHLTRCLPGYMIPSYFMQVGKMPLTSNGKLNRRALPLPVAKTGAAYAAPRNRIEERLTQLWSDVLAIEKSIIGIDDNFLELGGHSLKATVLASEIHKEFNVKVPLKEIFNRRFIRGFAEYIASRVRKVDDGFAAIEPIEKREYYPLSPAQKRLYILQQMDPNSTGYNIPGAIYLDKGLDLDKLEKTFKKLINRHESFRTSFEMVNEKPVQKIHDTVEFQVEYYKSDISECRDEPGYWPSDLEKEIEKIMENFVRPFDPGQAPILRIGRVSIQGKNILLVDMHHIISDEVSQQILEDELNKIYRGDELPKLKLQYKDYTQWHNSKEQQEKIKKQEKYWLKECSKELPVLILPTDFTRPAVQNFEGNHVRFSLDRTETEIIKRTAKEKGMTLNMVILSIYYILLAKLSGQEDIIIGVPTAARNHVELQRIIGMFVNILPLRNFPSEDKTFNEFLMEVKTKTLDAFENQEFQFEELVDKLSIGRDTNRNPIFDVGFTLINPEKPEKNTRESLGYDENDDYVHKKMGSKFDFSMIAIDNEEHLCFTFEYSTKLFKPATIERFIQYFRMIISVLGVSNEQKISHIEIVSKEEKEQLLFDFNDTKRDYPKHKTIHELFKEQVEKTPDRIALVDISAGRIFTTSVTYRELNKKSHQLARKLQTRGVKPDTIIAIMVERSIEMIVGILAILKVGGAYLPIDVEIPGKRIKYMLDDSSAPVLLTNGGVIKNHSFIGLQGLHSSEAKLHRTKVRKQVTDLEKRLPIPDRSLIDYEKYSNDIGLALAKNTIAIQATRGCPYKCFYCHKIWPKKHVFRSAEHIFDEIHPYYKMGVKRFVFVDDIFNLNIKNSVKFFKLIIENKLDVQFFFPNGVRGDILTRDYIDLMVEAGTIHLALALETASPRLQKVIKKNLNVDRLHENMVHICEKHPHVISELFTMHGFPTETEQEAQMTMDFIKSLKWVHLPLVNILKIYPNTDMADFALKNGISPEAIARSENLGYHELPETLPFDKNFTLKYQADFLDYILSKERLLHVLPYQMKTLTLGEMLQKYNSFLPTEINELEDLLKLAGITREELGPVRFLNENQMKVPDLDKKMKQHFAAPEKEKNALKILLIDVSRFFSGERDMLYDVNEPPLGLMYLLTYLNKTHGSKINGKIVKSRTDFDSYARLKTLLEEFKPDLIGIRNLTFFNQFFHKTVAMIRHWGFDAPIIAGGPYATSDYERILQDRNVDLVVLGEGEVTFSEFVGEFIKNNRKMPGEEVLKEIAGIAFVPGREKQTNKYAREVIMLDELSRSLKKTSDQDLERVGHPGDLAYTMFTSGSTGQPKAVLIDHQNVVRLVKNTNFVTLKAGDHLLQTAPLEFDASTIEIWGSLLNGLSLYLTNENNILNPGDVKEFIRKYEIDTMWMTSPLFNRMLEADIEIFWGLKNFMIGGDALSPAHVNQLRSRYPGLNVINGYGPTENTTFSTTYLVNKKYNGNISIGKPIPNSTAYILDKNNYVMPLGVAGELCVGGDGVSRGYLNNPGLTRERFIPNPFIKSDRLYKTGDRTRWLADGNIEFLGRLDHQVKIRGIRIELEEIESQLLNHEEIKEAVVLARKDKNGDKYLSAYIVSRNEQWNCGTKVDFPGIKKKLSENLPDYMLPHYFVKLEKIPLTSNGKVDRNALPEPQIVVGEDFIAPRDEIERKLVEIWSETLNVRKELIGIHSNFFELGGHSLKATILVNKLQKELNVKVPLAEIFKIQTIIGLSGYIKSSEPERFVPIESAEKKEYYELSSAQKRLYILQRMDPKSTTYNTPEAIYPDNEFDKNRLEKIFKELFKRHESLRTSFEMIKEKPVQIIHNHVEFETCDLSREANRQIGKPEEVTEIVIKNFIRPFDLSRAPLLRVGLVRLEGQRPILLVDIHHIITDGISMDLFVKEFMVLYAGNHLPALKFQYKDYAQWQNTPGQREATKQQEKYWLREFEGTVPLLNMPTDYVRPRKIGFEGRSFIFEINGHLMEKIRRLQSQLEVTLMMFLISIYKILLSKYTGQEELIVGTVIAGRRHADLENIIGFFVNMLPIRTRPDKNKRFSDYLLEVKEKALNAYENQDYQFEELVSKLEIQRESGRHPLIDAVFVLLDESKPARENVHLRPGDSPSNPLKVSHFDLMLYATAASDSINMVFEYSTALFKKKTIERISKFYLEILKLVVDNKDVELRKIKTSHEFVPVEPVIGQDSNLDFDF
jgi:amino acid adenylation domain-containing protein